MSSPSPASEPAAVAVSAAESFQVLAVDDQPEVLTSLRRLLRSRGFEIHGRTAPVEALAELERDPGRFDLIILDVNMPGMSGLELLSRAKEVAPDVPVIMLTADDSASTAVAALKAGAFNYLVKPLSDPDAVALTLNRAGTYSLLQRRARELEHRVSVSEKFERLVGASAPMRELFATIDKLSRTDVSVLIRGESGTGKELIARAIHSRSDRARGPFVALNCGAIPEALIDSELFGHTKGAFTGAVGARPGVFGEADGGTLFLDEIGDVPLPVQLRLLRVLQEREVRPVGGSGSRPVDVRVITATHVDLDAAVERKAFRADLYYRLNVVTVRVPPLRERMEDVSLLASHFVAKHAASAGRTAPRFTAAVVRALDEYSWPGNVRELENAVQHALALVHGEEIDVDSLPRRIVEPALAGSAAPGAAADAPGSPPIGADVAWADDMSFNDARKSAQQAFERTYLTRLLVRTDGNVSEAARVAGLDRSNFRRVLARHKINPEDYRSS